MWRQGQLTTHSRPTHYPLTTHSGYPGAPPPAPPVPHGAPCSATWAPCSATWALPFVHVRYAPECMCAMPLRACALCPCVNACYAPVCTHAMPLRERMLCPCVHACYAPACTHAMPLRACALCPCAHGRYACTRSATPARRGGGPGGEKPVLQTSLEYQVKYNSSYLEIVFARKQMNA